MSAQNVVKNTAATAALAAALSMVPAVAAYADEPVTNERVDGPQADDTAVKADTSAEAVVEESSPAAVPSSANEDAPAEAVSTKSESNVASSDASAEEAATAESAPAAAPVAHEAAESPAADAEAKLDGTIQSFISETQSKADAQWTGTSSDSQPSASSAHSVSASRVQLRAAASGGSSGGGVSPAGGLELSVQMKDESGSYVDLYDYLRAHPGVSVASSSADIVSVDGTTKHHGLDFLWSPITYRFSINDRPASKPDAVGSYRARVKVTLSDGRVLDLSSNVFKIYPKDVTFADLVAEKEQARKPGVQNEYFVDVPRVSTLKGLGLAENQGATDEQKKDMATFEMPEGDSWVNGSAEHGVYSEVGNAVNADSERLVIKKGSHVTFNNMKFNSSVRLVVEEGATLTLRQCVVFGKIEVHGTLTAPEGTTVTDTVYMRPGSTLKDAKIASHARYLTDGNVAKPETDVVVATDGDVTIEGTVQIEGDNGSSERQGQIPFVVHSGTVTLADGAVLKTNGGDTDLIYNQNGGSGILMFDGTAIKGAGEIVTVGGNSKAGTAGSGVSVATEDADGGVTFGKGRATISVSKLSAAGGNSAMPGEPTPPFEGGSSRTAGNGIDKGIDVSGAGEVNAAGGAGEKAGVADANKTIESDAVTGVSSFDIAWGIGNAAAASTTSADAHVRVRRAPGSEADYSGYKLTVGVFDADGNQVGGNYEVAYNGGPVTVEGLDSSKTYRVRVLGLVDADGNDALADFETVVTKDEKTVAGEEQEVWTKLDELKPGQKGVTITFEQGGKTYMLGMNSNNKVVVREVQMENGVPKNTDENFKWDVEAAPNDSIALSIAGKDKYLVMGFTGLTMKPSSSYYNYEFTTVDGVLRGNGAYRQFIKVNNGSVSADYNEGTPYGAWQLTKETPTTKTVTFNITSTPLAKYTVKWLNDDGTELEVDTGVRRGAKPSYDGAEPAKAADAQYTYTFAGWDAAIAPVTGDVIYTAIFNRTLNTYTVTWANEDGTVIETDAGVPYGTMPSFDSAEPTKAEDDENTYAFAGWDSEVNPVTGDVTYTAMFKATPKPKPSDPTNPSNPSNPSNPADQNHPSAQQNKPGASSDMPSKSDSASDDAKGAPNGKASSEHKGAKSHAAMPKTGDATDAALPLGAVIAAGFTGLFALRRKGKHEA